MSECWKLQSCEGKCIPNCIFNEPAPPKGAKICFNCTNWGMCKTLHKQAHYTCERFERVE